jgi:hypothetical protein
MKELVAKTIALCICPFVAYGFGTAIRRAIAQRLGKTPTTNDINEQSKAGRSFPLNNYYDVFGNFLEALKKAGLKSNYKQRFDKEKLLGELSELLAKLKRPLLGKDVLAARKKAKYLRFIIFSGLSAPFRKRLKRRARDKKLTLVRK